MWVPANNMVVDSICVLGLGQVRWVLPAAYAHPPVMAVTGNMQKRMSSWFDICIFDFPLTIPPPGKEDDAGILKSIAFIDALLTEIVQSGVDPSCIVLGGISQGAAMNLLTGLTTAKKLAGLIVLSARLPLRHKFKSMVSAHASSIPIFWGHGNADPLVSYKLSRVCVEYLVTEIGLDFHTYYRLAHYIRDDKLTDIASWLKKILAPSEPFN
ncbi:Phospholipase/carboxylesterase [Mycena albidolilacea]|uniref:Acyl-protein thioesterase 1 n=1 Tax=Mycena albidolilacea TaxID=1033008 RepID=A0AAD7F066_9AGAR|nr:Phospholipase/carboxylesterase [Mycena albidolilacea]